MKKRPTLESERMILRQFRESDFEDYAKLCADPDVMRYLLGKAFTRVEAWRHMAFLIGHWELRDYGYFVAEEKGTGAFLGRMGFSYPDGWPGFELGWTLAPAYQGKGFATEGARVLLEHAFRELDQPHVISCIHPDNAPSIRVAKRLGETLEGETTVLDMPVLIYGIDRPDLAAMKRVSQDT